MRMGPLNTPREYTCACPIQSPACTNVMPGRCQCGLCRGVVRGLCDASEQALDCSGRHAFATCKGSIAARTAETMDGPTWAWCRVARAGLRSQHCGITRGETSRAESRTLVRHLACPTSGSCTLPFGCCMAAGQSGHKQRERFIPSRTGHRSCISTSGYAVGHGAAAGREPCQCEGDDWAWAGTSRATCSHGVALGRTMPCWRAREDAPCRRVWRWWYYNKYSARHHWRMK